jgi:vitellogenic carboxypeptidase-like protein
VQPYIHLAGLGVGDGWTDPIHQVAPYADEMYDFSLLSDAQHAEALATYVNPALAAIASGDYLQGFDIWDKFLNGDVWPYASYYYNVTGVTDYYNIMRDAEPASFGNWETFVTQPAILNAIHAGNHSENSGTTVEMALLSDFMYSLAPQMTEMLDAGIRMLIYNGQLDVIIGAPLTENYLWNLQWSGAPAYHNATKIIWHVDGLVAGYVRQTDAAKGLTQAVVRGCGHILPADNPARALDLITRWIQVAPYN